MAKIFLQFKIISGTQPNSIIIVIILRQVGRVHFQIARVHLQSSRYLRGNALKPPGILEMQYNYLKMDSSLLDMDFS